MGNSPESLKIEGNVWKKYKSIYDYPCDSSKLQMWKLKNRPTNEVVIRPINAINNKLVKLSIASGKDTQKVYAIGMLH